MMPSCRAMLLIAHGSRRAAANEDLEYVAAAVRERGLFDIVAVSYLELAPPTILEAGRQCVESGATEIIMLPYFLSPGVHVVEDLESARQQMAEAHPGVRFNLAQPLGRHPKLVDIVLERAAACR
jgi:sirohydrochlorin ferrochelatase